MTDRELMQQALEALQEINKLSVGENAIFLPAEIDGAMDALRERLAQPEQYGSEHYREMYLKVRDELAALQQRPWVGLTDEEKKSAIGSDSYFYSGALWAESKLKEKNT